MLKNFLIIRLLNSPLINLRLFNWNRLLRLTWKRSFFIIILLMLILAYIYTNVLIPKWYGNKNIRIYGTFSTRYRNVVDVFRENFASGLDHNGAHIVVYERGYAVIDIWAGYADLVASRRWAHDTQSILFSISKSLSSLCIAKLVDTGQLRWDDRVADFWPEFAANGKENTTIDHILTHQSGLPYIEEPITIADVQNRTSVHAKLASAKPVWPPGTATGYHAITQGFLIDALIERVDSPRHRTLGEFFDEEFAQVYDLDISFGIRTSNDAVTRRVAEQRIVRFSLLDWWEFVCYLLLEPRIVAAYALIGMQPSDAPIHRMMSNPDWIHVDTESGFFNDVRLRRLALGSLTGIASARSLARLYALLLEGQLFQQASTLNALLRPLLYDWHWERVVLYPVMKGRGFFYEYHPREPNKFVFGHPGYGCQTLHLDAERNIVVVYLSNTIKPASSVLCTPYQRILRAIYRSVYDYSNNTNIDAKR